ncbi:MAG: hypothetical protein WCO63_01780 [Bacteroidota bacterium]
MAYIYDSLPYGTIVAPFSGMKKQIIFLITFLFISCHGFAQDSIHPKPRSISIQAEIGLYGNEAIHHQFILGSAQNVLEIKYGTCRQIGILTTIPIFHRINLYTGASWKFLNVTNTVTSPPGSPVNHFFNYNYRDNYWSIPIFFSYPILTKNRNQVLLKAGMAFNYAEWGISEGYGSDDSVSMYVSQLTTNNESTWNTSAELGISWRHLFRGRSYLELSLNGSYAPQIKSVGYINTYENNVVVTREKLEANHNSIGLTIAYGLNINKKLTEGIVNTIPIVQKPNPRTFGFKAGVNKSIIDGKEADGTKTGLISTEAYAAFFYNTRMEGRWDFETELLFSWTDAYPFIEVPVHVKYWLNNRIGIFAGPKLDISMGDPDNFRHPFSAITTPNNYNTFGLSLDLGLQCRLSKRFFY